MRVLGVGINATRNAPLDVFTEFAPPLVEVQTGAPGLSTEEVYSLVSHWVSASDALEKQSSGAQAQGR